MKKNLLLPALLTLLPMLAHSQASNSELEAFKQNARQSYSAYKDKADKDFKDFRDKANAEYADFMRKRWEAFRSSAAIPVPPMPEPVKPPVVDPDKKPDNVPMPFGEVVPPPAPVKPPMPVAPVPQEPEPVKPAFQFSFFHTSCGVNLTADHKFTLRGTAESDVADAWSFLSNSRYNAAINDCLRLREQLNLCDWGYLQLLQEMTEKFFGSKTSNEAVLLQMYILTQSGYKVRIAKSGERLALLLPFQQTIYEHSFLEIEGVKYFIVDKSLKGGAFHVFNHEFPNEQFVSMQVVQPKLEVIKTSKRSFASRRYPELHVSVETNRNLIDFYNAYPTTSEWNLYARASLSASLKAELYPALRTAIADKSKPEAANMLVNFVQTAFEYETDDKQFGYERPLFADETFFYPASDCEDRSILYAVLVRELLGLEVVLLHYPGHLATAVHFADDTTGDNLTIDGKQFLVCDPTYIGANIGHAMEQFRGTKAKVVKLY
jgi:hypothetical protein